MTAMHVVQKARLTAIDTRRSECEVGRCLASLTKWRFLCMLAWLGYKPTQMKKRPQKLLFCAE